MTSQPRLPVVPTTKITEQDMLTQATLSLVDAGDAATFTLVVDNVGSRGVVHSARLEVSTCDLDALELLHGRLGLLITRLTERTGKA